MTLVVPYDGSALAEAAIDRAEQFRSSADEEIVVVTVIPNNESYARERGWLQDDEAFTLNAVVSTLRERTVASRDGVSFRYVTVGRYAATGTIASRIRTEIQRVGAEVVFIGSDNAGRVVTSIASVGSKVAAEDAYDIFIVRRPSEAA